MNNEITVLLYATIFILLLLILILLYLVIRKTLENNRNEKVAKKKTEIELSLFESLSQGTDFQMATQDRFSLQALEELLKKYSDTVGGTYETLTLSVIAEKYLSSEYTKDLKSRSWSKRINALYHIEDFKMFRLSDEVEQLLTGHSISKEEVVLSIRILAAADEMDDVFLYVNGMYNHLTDFDYRSILSKLTDESFHVFVDKFSKCHPTLQWSILEIIAIKKDLSFLSFVETVFQQSSGETRIRSLKAISSIGFTTDIEQFYPLSQSSEWQERMLIAKLVGFFPFQMSYKILENLIHDQNWWVRSQAAQSFTKLPKGREQLKILMESSSDPYARDIASEWLFKGEI